MVIAWIRTRSTTPRSWNWRPNHLAHRTPTQSSLMRLKLNQLATSTERSIPENSFHSYQHKVAPTMIHLPPTEGDFKIEQQHIVDSARKRGYKSTTVETLIWKHVQRIERSNLTALYNQQLTRNPSKRSRANFSNISRHIRTLHWKCSTYNWKDQKSNILAKISAFQGKEPENKIFEGVYRTDEKAGNHHKKGADKGDRSGYQVLSVTHKIYGG